MHGGHCISCGNEELFENYRKVQMGPTHSWKMRSYLKTQGVWENDFKNHKKCMPIRKHGTMNFIKSGILFAYGKFPRRKFWKENIAK